MDELLRILKALADETRFNIVNLLLVHDFCVRALAKQLSLSEAAVSQHLQVLRKAGVVKGEKRGYFTHYWVDREVLNQAAENIKMVASQTLPCKDNYGENSSSDTDCVERRDRIMCKCTCEHPELKPKDEKCSEEQIKECHGDVEEHLCDCDCEKK